MKRLEQETKQANEQLTAVVKSWKAAKQTLYDRMRDMLQACTKMEETAPIIMGFMKEIVPRSQGLYFYLSIPAPT